MPHNLYLHSALVKSRNVDRKKNEAVRQANMYYFVEAAIALLVRYTLEAYTLYNAILRIARNFLETRENIKISTHPFYHINLG